MDTHTPLIDLATARALVGRGWAVVPTESDEEKRPKAKFATAKSWRDFSDRLPSDAELLGWFGPKPRRGGVVLHKGQLVVDFDTKDTPPDPGTCHEESAKGYHLFCRCPADAKIGHDHERKIDYLTYGSFVRLCAPRRLLDWDGELPPWQGETPPTAVPPPSGGTVRDSLIAAGWKPLGVHGNREDFSRPGAAHPGRCDASLFDGQSLKVWSTTAQSAPAEDAQERVPPALLSFEALRAGYPEVPPPLVGGLLRRGETMLLFGKPKVQKSLRMLELASAVACGGEWAGFRCEKARVLVIDNETHPALLADRFERICAKAARATDGVDFLPVWDGAYSVEDMLRDAPHFGGYGLIVFDILARGLPDWCESESDNRQCAKVWACVQKTAALTGAAVAVVHHARKSTTADIVSDPSGAGWTRYASTIASLAKKDKEPGVWLEAVCRSFPSPQPRRL